MVARFNDKILRKDLTQGVMHDQLNQNITGRWRKLVP